MFLLLTIVRSCSFLPSKSYIFCIFKNHQTIAKVVVNIGESYISTTSCDCFAIIIESSIDYSGTFHFCHNYRGICITC